MTRPRYIINYEPDDARPWVIFNIEMQTIVASHDEFDVALLQLRALRDELAPED